MIKEKISDVQSGYDLVAEEYARRIYDELRHKPLDCRLLDRFAESVRNAGVACDLGCGPGQIARYLQGRGIQIRGMDLSEGMIQCARQLNPGIEFRQGDMRALPVADNAWAGIAAFYAIVNLPPDDLVQALQEMMRVLVPGGRLLLSFHIGEDTSHVEDLWGSGAVLEFHLFRVSTVADSIRRAGFDIEEIIEREPYVPEVEYQSRRAYIFAQKPRTKIVQA
jgi:ubiquinone/menaquinone biosynthesis C-methylase UbiE